MEETIEYSFATFFITNTSIFTFNLPALTDTAYMPFKGK